jgi:NADPH:quinone reductase-like Zn-dependent oxidoreductase
MRTIALIKNGAAETAFAIQEQAMPTPSATQVCVKVEAFGLNYADVMARLGLYEDAPPLPAVLGYEVVGRIHSIGSDVQGCAIGDRVVAMTRFGGYAEYAVTEFLAMAKIPETMDAGVAAALCTQYITAYHAACEQTNLFAGDKVLIHAAAGGVGIALIQIAKSKGCKVYATCGSDEKVAFLRSLGVDMAINYTKNNWVDVIKQANIKLDAIFDSLGGKGVAQGIKLLASGGRMIAYGAANMSGKGSKNMLNVVGTAVGFGIYSPIEFLTTSKAFIGINMLRIADNQPHIIKRNLEAVVKMQADGILNPHIGGVFAAADIAKAHDLLGGRGSIGKVICVW